MDWELKYGDTIRELVTKTKGLAHWEPVSINPKARRKIGIAGRGKGRTYIAFLYHACQKLGVRILEDGSFKVHARNKDLMTIAGSKVIGGPESDLTLEKQKEELKAYTKEAVG